MTVTGQARVIGALALISSVVLTLIVLGFTLLALALAADHRDGGYCESIDHPARCDSEGLIATVGFSLTGLGVWGAAAGAGLLRGRWWARRSAMFVFSAWALLVSALLVVTAVDDGGVPVTGVLAWFLPTGLCFAIVYLAADLPPRVSDAPDSAGGAPRRPG